MAAISQFFITVLLTNNPGTQAAGAGTPTNPINAPSFQVVTPWGKSSLRSSLYECFEDIIFPSASGGGNAAGPMGAYMNSQTTNGLTTQAGQTVPLNANEV